MYSAATHKSHCGTEYCHSTACIRTLPQEQARQQQQPRHPPLPQVYTSPCAVSATECQPPAAMSAMARPSRSLMRLGVVL